MKIDKKHIKIIKTIGYLDNIPVDLISCRGGFNILIIMKKNNESEIIGIGPHTGIAKYQASKRYPNIKWSENG